MRSDGLLHRIGNMLQEKVGGGGGGGREGVGDGERGRDGARKKFGVFNSDLVRNRRVPITAC